MAWAVLLLGCIGAVKAEKQQLKPWGLPEISYPFCIQRVCPSHKNRFGFY